MHTRTAGMTTTAIEEDRYVNGSMIPPAQRLGCYVRANGIPIPLLKSEAGWDAGANA